MSKQDVYGALASRELTLVAVWFTKPKRLLCGDLTLDDMYTCM